RLRAAGLPMCRPEIRPIAECVSYLDESYNVSLALRVMQAATTPGESTTGGIVTKPMTFDAEHGRVWVLTGPNRGGKTTYARAVGLAHLLFQAGLYVPACTARMSPSAAWWLVSRTRGSPAREGIAAPSASARVSPVASATRRRSPSNTASATHNWRVYLKTAGWLQTSRLCSSPGSSRPGRRPGSPAGRASRAATPSGRACCAG